MTVGIYRLPFPNPDLRDGFGSMIGRQHPHRGLDFAQPAGTRIPAISEGTVAAITHSAALGFVTVVRHERTRAERALGRQPVFSGYAHQDHYPLHLELGDPVAIGAIVGQIGLQGRNGTAARGEHLHLTLSHSVRGVIEGEVFDPYPFIRRRTAGPKPAKVRRYRIKRGDTLSGIAARYRVPVGLLARANGIDDPDLIIEGEELVIP